MGFWTISPNSPLQTLWWEGSILMFCGFCTFEGPLHSVCRGLFWDVDKNPYICHFEHVSCQNRDFWKNHKVATFCVVKKWVFGVFGVFWCFWYQSVIMSHLPWEIHESFGSVFHEMSFLSLFTENDENHDFSDFFRFWPLLKPWWG